MKIVQDIKNFIWPSKLKYKELLREVTEIDSKNFSEWYYIHNNESLDLLSVSDQWYYSGQANKDLANLLKISTSLRKDQIFVFSLYMATGMRFAYLKKIDIEIDPDRTIVGDSLWFPEQPIEAYSVDGRCIYSGLFENFPFEYFQKEGGKIFLTPTSHILEGYKVVKRRLVSESTVKSEPNVWYQNSKIMSQFDRTFDLYHWAKSLSAQYVFLKIRRKLPTQLLDYGRWAAIVFNNASDGETKFFDLLTLKVDAIYSVPPKDTDVRIFNRFAKEIYQGPVGNFPQKMFEENYGRVLIWLEQYEEEKEV